MGMPTSILITGATSGIGWSLCHHYHHLGYKVFACGRNQEKLGQLARLGMKTFAFDVNDESQVAQIASQVPPLNLLLLNAGDCRYIDDAVNFDHQLFSQIVQTNLVSVGTLLHYFLPKVISGGQVAFISSSATLVPFPKAEAYGASKAGIDYLANSLRIDLTSKKIDVTLIHPGFVKTPLTDKNQFSMPFMLTSEQAAQRIFNGIFSRKKTVQFPKRLTWTLRLFSMLPTTLWQKIITPKPANKPEVIG